MHQERWAHMQGWFTDIIENQEQTSVWIDAKGPIELDFNPDLFARAHIAIIFPAPVNIPGAWLICKRHRKTQDTALTIARRDVGQ